MMTAHPADGEHPNRFALLTFLVGAACIPVALGIVRDPDARKAGWSLVGAAPVALLVLMLAGTNAMNAGVAVAGAAVLAAATFAVSARLVTRRA
jgi:hypothetical protein